MRTMRFSALYLLSLRERRGLSVKFSPDVTLLIGRNGFGKSAVMKSLYEAFGASPHKVDSTWQSAGVSTLVEFQIDDDEFSMLRVGSSYSVYDKTGTRLIETSSITSELSPFFAELFDFKLLMTTRSGETVIPPPAYIFAPYYVDQDKSWATPWQSFDRMYLPNSPQALAEYHTGIRPNEYYALRAERDQIQADLKEMHDQRRSVEAALVEVRDLVGKALNLSLEDFTSEVEALVSRSSELNASQNAYRTRLSNLESERDLWNEQQDILRATLAEMRESVHLAAEQPETVDCPTCGQHYENSIADQFGLISDFDDLFGAYQEGRERLANLEKEIGRQRASLKNVVTHIREVETVLQKAKGDTTLDDVISSRGRAETDAALRRRLGALDTLLGEAFAQLREADRSLKRITDPKRTERITSFFAKNFGAFARQLDVRATYQGKGVSATRLPRGSEGPRGLVSYYYAILQTAREFGSSVFCPILVDAPNQQGQDSEHLPAILKFLAAQRPSGSQVIIASEESFGVFGDDVHVVEVGIARNQVLSESEFESVAQKMRPLLGQLL
jgi:hypothetical protein